MNRIGPLALASTLMVLMPLGLGTAPAHAAPPITQAIFSSPGGGQIHELLATNIADTPRGATIRASTMTFTSGVLAKSLIAAHERGVNVQLVVATHPNGCNPGNAIVNFLVMRLASPGGESSLTCTRGSARGASGAGLMHSKVWTFTETGSQSKVTVVTSMNLTDEAQANQWNNAYQIVGRDDVFQAWNKTFAELKDDTPLRTPFQRWTWPNLRAYVNPVGSAPDPVLARIRSLPVGAKVDIAMSAMVGNRAEQIARALANKQRDGATVRFLYSEPINGVALRRLQDAGIPTRKAMSGDNYLHHKYMTASFARSGQQIERVWTGSEVWTDRALLSDEYVLRADSAQAYQSYASNFQLLWDAFDPGA